MHGVILEIYFTVDVYNTLRSRSFNMRTKIYSTQKAVALMTLAQSQCVGDDCACEHDAMRHVSRCASTPKRCGGAAHRRPRRDSDNAVRGTCGWEANLGGMMNTTL